MVQCTYLWVLFHLLQGRGEALPQGGGGPMSLVIILKRLMSLSEIELKLFDFVRILEQAKAAPGGGVRGLQTPPFILKIIILLRAIIKISSSPIDHYKKTVATLLLDSWQWSGHSLLWEIRSRGRRDMPASLCKGSSKKLDSFKLVCLIK